jgi:chromosomal replication initiator protein
MWISKIVAKPTGAVGFDGDLEPAEGGSSSDEAFELQCPSSFHAVRVRDFFLKQIADCLHAELGRRVALRVGVIDEAAADQPDADHDTGSSAAPMLDDRKAAAHSVEEAPSRGARPTPGKRRAPRPDPKRSSETLPIGDALGSILGGAGPAPGTAAAAASLPEGEEREGCPAVAKSVPVKATPVPVPTPAPTPTPPEPAARKKAMPERTRRAVAARAAAVHPVAAAGGGSGAMITPRQPTFPLTFDSFTVGPGNALAREAAMALASPPSAGAALGLNQVFVVSGAGLGKTHLARAAVVEGARSIGARARYTTAETFTSEFTSAIRANKMQGFKRRYRGECDLLVMDDVQFLEGKDATQLEFFHTMQHVLNAGGRVLLTGDRFPQELTHLDPRVRARISSGIVAELEPPDEGLRREILRAKAAHGGVRLPDDCVDLLTDRVEGNVRELEGALIQLVTMASLFKRSIDLDLARESLEGRTRSLRVVRTPATTQLVIETVAGFFKTSPEALASRSRRRDVLVPRQIAMYLCRRFTDASLADIGRALNRDHPSVANAIRKIERDLLENVRLRYTVEALIARLGELGHRALHTAD